MLAERGEAGEMGLGGESSGVAEHRFGGGVGRRRPLTGVFLSFLYFSKRFQMESWKRE